MYEFSKDDLSKIIKLLNLSSFKIKESKSFTKFVLSEKSKSNDKELLEKSLFTLEENLKDCEYLILKTKDIRSRI